MFSSHTTSRVDGPLVALFRRFCVSNRNDRKPNNRTDCRFAKRETAIGRIANWAIDLPAQLGQFARARPESRTGTKCQNRNTSDTRLNVDGQIVRLNAILERTQATLERLDAAQAAATHSLLAAEYNLKAITRSHPHLRTIPGHWPEPAYQRPFAA